MPDPTTPASGDELSDEQIEELWAGASDPDSAEMSIYVFARAVIAADRAARPATGVPPHLAEVLAFLWGEAPLDGVWFGEKHPTLKGNFWWRNFIPRPSPNGEDREVERDAARYRHLREGKARTSPPSRRTVGRIEVLQWESTQEANVLKGDALDAAIDAAIQSDAARAAGGEEQNG